MGIDIAHALRRQDFNVGSDLRGLDVDIGDDMLACLDALRLAKLDLYKLVPNGEGRVEAVFELWGMKWPTND